MPEWNHVSEYHSEGCGLMAYQEVLIKKWEQMWEHQAQVRFWVGQL